MSSLNQSMLIGHLGKDPEVIKETSQGIFAKFSVATTKKYTDQEGTQQKDTQWHTVCVNKGLGKTAVAYLKKGAKVYVSGELRTHQWEDKKGQTRYSTEIHAKELKFLSKPSEKKAEAPESLASDMSQLMDHEAL